MSSDKQNLPLYAGDDCILAISIVDESGAPLSLAGASLTWTLGKSPSGPTILTKTTSNGVTITDSAGGAVSVSIPHSDTAALSGNLWHQLVITDSGGDVSTVTTGYILVKPRL